MTECLPWEQTKAARIGYLQAHAEAERRLKAGQRQKLCCNCGRWCWGNDEATEHFQSYAYSERRRKDECTKA